MPTVGGAASGELPENSDLSADDYGAVGSVGQYEPEEDTMRVGFIGLGSMGSAMAARLIDAGNELSIWNRSSGPAEQLTQRGAHRLDTPAEVFSGDAVLTMLADDDSVRAVVLANDALKRAPNKKLVHVVMSTISVAFARELERAHAAAGLAYVAAPVLGRPEVAAAGKLNIIAAGGADAIERVRPLLDVIGQRTWVLGAEPHKANVAKLSMNFLIGAAIEAMAEAVTLAERYEVEPAKLMALITGTLFSAPVYATYGALILKGEFMPANFKLTLGLKDMRLALAAGETAGVPMPFASIVRDNLVDAIGHGDADKDWSAVALVARRRAGLDGGTRRR
jgi:3-hydroxyisobutyrate dehydrogenase-like beta-hydroxyacid dehydrogenase